MASVQALRNRTLINVDQSTLQQSNIGILSTKLEHALHLSTDVILNCTNLRYMDSYAMSRIVEQTDAFDKKDLYLYLSNIQTSLRNHLRLFGAIQKLKIVESETTLVIEFADLEEREVA